MNKRLVYLAVGVLCLGAMAAYWLVWSSDPYRNKSFQHSLTEKDLTEFAAKNGLANQPPAPVAVAPIPLDPNQAVRVALGSLGMADDDQNRQLADLVTVELTGAPALELVDRQSIDRVLQEQDMNLTGFVRAKDAVRVGKLLKADWFLFGTTATASGTHSTVVRLVDARTGVLRNVGVFPQAGGPPELAKALAGFIRESRQNANASKPHVYLALGAFEDYSLNNRQADFPAQLRAHLIAGLQKSDITLLEREYVDALWQEIQLDLAGLTEDSGAGAQPLQSACWIVTGSYQSYENNGFEVEVLLNIANIFGLHPIKAILRGPPEEGLYRQIQQEIEKTISGNAVILVPSRRSEATEQMEIGKDLFDEHGQANQAPFGNFSIDNGGMIFIAQMDASLRGTEVVRRMQNIQEAIRAFQTVLVLEPTNREAKFCLAACLQNPIIIRREEAREYYRQILDEPVDDKWSGLAKWDLLHTFDGEGPWGEQPWYAEAAGKSVNPQAKAYFQQQADMAAKGMRGPQDQDNGKGVETVSNTVSLVEAKTNLLKEIRTHTDHLSLTAAMERFGEAFGTNQAATARALIDFLPEMEAAFPELRPNLQGAVVSLQVDTNAPIIAELQKTLTWCDAHPEQEQVSKDYFYDFWRDMQSDVLPWCYGHGCFQLAEIIVEHEQKQRAANGYYFEDDRPVLALEYVEHEQWANALKIFQGYSNRPIIFRTTDYLNPVSGQWVERSGPVLTGRYSAFCEEKLGRPHNSDPREFEMGERCLELDDASVFTTDATGLWLAGHGELRHLNFDLKPDFTIALPVNGGVPFIYICTDESHVWAGTDGAGLVEFDKVSHQCRQFTVKDGMLMDAVSRLYPEGNNLWIGYGNGNNGGLGKLDLSAQQFKSYMPAFSADGYIPQLTADPPDGPPRHPVTSLTCMANGDVLALVSGKGLQRFSVASNTWATLPEHNGFGINFVAVNDRYWVEGVSVQQVEVEIESKVKGSQTNNQPKKMIFAVSQEQLAQATANAMANSNLWVRRNFGKLCDQGGLEIYDLKNARWQTLKDIDGLPNPPGTVAWDGDDLWVGGVAYLAEVDLQHAKVLKYSYVATGWVKWIHTGGGYVWAQYNGWLHRASLAAP